MNALRKRVPFMTAEEFLVWEPGDGRHWQLVDGQPQAMAPAGGAHGIIQAEIAGRLRDALRARGGPCRVVIAPGVRPLVGAHQNVRIPDIAVTCDPADRSAAVISRPRLVVEILSPSNHAETWSNVWTYTTIPSVEDILVVSSVRREAHLLHRSAGDPWPDSPTLLTEGTLTLASVDLSLPVADLYAGSDLEVPPGA